MFLWPARCGALGGCALLAALAFSSGFAQPNSQTPSFRVDVNLVRVVATVRNKTGELVGNLQKADFQILDNGAPQELALFERHSDQPLSVALLVDISGSTAKDLKFETESATRFLKVLLNEGNLEDTVALYGFNWQVTQYHGFTHSLVSLSNALKLLRGEAGTSLYDAIYLAAADLEDREGRKVMVVVTDGGDTTSSKSLKQALQAVQLADAVIYPIVIMPITSDAGRNIGGENALKFMADGTGGRTFLPQLNTDLDRSFSAIVDELRTQYLLGFYPRNVPLTKDRFHKLEVRVTNPELRVSARNGYYGDAEGDPVGAAPRVLVAPAARKQ
ncbi:MAG TPA: VWA domain-containing protein [Bryobacteraceae bacterium]|nr:VWA domain-containing protein [Bryobacteraceae bacterium]